MAAILDPPSSGTARRDAEQAASYCPGRTCPSLHRASSPGREASPHRKPLCVVGLSRGPYNAELAHCRDSSQIEALQQAGPIAMADWTIQSTGTKEALHAA